MQTHGVIRSPAMPLCQTNFMISSLSVQDSYVMSQNAKQRPGMIEIIQTFQKTCMWTSSLRKSLNLYIPAGVTGLFAQFWRYTRLPATCLDCPPEALAGQSSNVERPCKMPRPVLRPFSAPEVVAARASCKPKTPAPEFGELLTDSFASGSSSAAQVFSVMLKRYVFLCSPLQRHSLTLTLPLTHFFIAAT